MPENGIIYKTTNLVNGKIYVGMHYRIRPGYLGSGKILRRAIDKYGKENFIRETIDEFESIEEGCCKERYWIKELNSKSPNGYNLCDGGEGVVNMCHESKERHRKNCSAGKKKYYQEHPEARERVRKLRKGKLPWNTGKHFTEEQREVLSKAHLGKRPSMETRKKMSLTQTQRWKERKLNGTGGVS